MPRSRRPLLLAFVLLGLAVACRDATGPGDVRLYTLPGHLAIANDGTSPLFSIAFDESLLPLIDWIPCVSDECGMVEPGTTRYFVDDSIPGSGPGRVVVIHYWRATMGPGGVLVPGPITRRRIRLDSGLIN